MAARQTPFPSVLYEDDSLIAFDKPAGLAVSPDRWNEARENLVRLVHERFSPAWSNVHRIDAEVSGVVLFAKTKEALDVTTGRLQARDVTRIYSALVRGTPESPEGTVALAVEPDPNHPGRMQTARAGKPAETAYRTVVRWRGFARLEVRPLSNRPHQVRVHLASLGCPLLGDPLYGDGRGLLLSELKRGYRHKQGRPECPLIGRLALHAAALIVKHPVTGIPLTIEAPLPKDFRVALKYLDRFAGASPAPAAGEG